MAWTISLKSKVGLGVLLSYTSFEVYMQIRTKYVILARRQQVKKLTAGDDEVDISKFKSATVAGMFVNPFEEYRPQTAFEFLVVRLMEVAESIYGNRIELHDKLPKPFDGAVEVEDLLKLMKPDLERMRQNSLAVSSTSKTNSSQALFTWLGQSCSLIQISGINFLTDPIMSDHLINKVVGPKRLIKSPMTLDDIKYATNDNLDFVLVSHDHPDHLELDVAKKIGNSTTWIVPLGLKKKLARKGIYKIIEMDWWDSVDLSPYISNTTDKYEIVCVPAMHWSGRYIVDSNKSLWCSFIIRRNGKSLVYHAGDTGYAADLFKVIGKKYGPVSLGLLPIGQYCPSWHQKPRHISPEESLKIYNELSIKYMKGVHWGTFKLSGEPILEPKFLLEKLAKECGKEATVKVPEFGLTYVYDLEKESETELHV